MKFWIRAHSIEIPFPAKEAPTWASKSDRWYQLDQPGYSFPQAYTLLKEILGPHPEYLVLASPKASNQTDRDFVTTGASSPSKFVHTLPNIRAVSLLQAMEWAGPMLCVQSDPRTLLAGLETALLELEVQTSESLDSKSDLNTVWVLGFVPVQNRVELYVVSRTKFLSPGLDCQTPRSDCQTIEVTNIKTAEPFAPLTDKDWLDWVYNGPSSGFNLSEHYKATHLSGD